MGKDVKFPVIHLYHTQDGAAYKAKIREDKIYCKGENVPQFTNRGVFTIKGLKLAKRSKLKCVIYLDGKAKACKITNGKEMKSNIKAENTAEANEEGLNLEDILNTQDLETIPDALETIFEPLTYKDRKTVVKREIAKQLGKFKPMETWQFIALMALVAVSLAFQFIFR